MKQQTKFKQTEIGMIPEDWGIETTEEVMKMITDFVANGSFASLAENVKYYEAPKEAILVRLVDYNNNFSDRFVYVDEKGYNFLKKSKLLGGEIIISNVGAYAGTVFRTPKLDKKMTLGPNSIMMNAKTSNDFYFYWFLSPLGQASIRTILTGSANPKFNKTDFRKLKVPVPSLPEQSAIASILSSLDAKIELNNQMNKTLEAVGQALFKRWFVDFEFPNEKGKPYKSSGGKMVESELRTIPDGWRVGKLGEIVNIIKGVSYSSNELQESKKALVTLKSMNRGGGLNNEGFKEFIGEYKTEQEIIDGDIILACTDLTQKAEVIGRPAIVRSISKYESIIASLDLVIIRPKDKQTNKPFLYYLLNSENFQNHVQGFTNGTTVLHLSSRAIPEYLLAMPAKNNNVNSNFGDLIQPLLDYKRDNEAQSDTLMQIRDSLLPKLMSGKIRVNVK
jgi:type I restriction enzyme S subunit